MPRFQFLVAHALGHTHSHEGPGEDATVKTAQRIPSALLGHELSEEEKKTVGPVLHYAYRTSIGKMYSGLAQKYLTITLGFGCAYGAAAWLHDEIAVPALRLGKSRRERQCPSIFNCWPLTSSMASRWKVFAVGSEDVMNEAEAGRKRSSR
jgi:hypothetical protein